MHTIVVLLFSFVFCCITATAQEILYPLSETGSGRATAYAETNKIVTVGSKTHMAWLDSEGEHFFARIRMYDHETKEWSKVYTLGEAYDNHGGPALTADSQGYLHVVYYPHHHPFRYRQSLKPNDASAWTEEVQFGSKCTYPSMVCDRDDTLYLVCRESVDQNWKLNFYKKTKDGEWSGPLSLFEGASPKNYKRYQGSLVLGHDGKSLHVAFQCFEREFDDRAYLIGYMESFNGGESWQHRSGRSLILPANPGTVEVVEMGKPELTTINMRMGSMALDKDAMPWILYSRLDTKPYEAFLATVGENDEWIKMPLLPVIQKHDPNRGVQTPGSVVFGEDGTMYVAVTTVQANSSYENSFWGDPSDEIVLLVSKDSGKTVEMFDVSKPDDTVPNWLPSMQRSVNSSPIEIPFIMYTHGFRGGNNKEIMANEVVWCDVSKLIH